MKNSQTKNYKNRLVQNVLCGTFLPECSFQCREDYFTWVELEPSNCSTIGQSWLVCSSKDRRGVISLKKKLKWSHGVISWSWVEFDSQIRMTGDNVLLKWSFICNWELLNHSYYADRSHTTEAIRRKNVLFVEGWSWSFKTTSFWREKNTNEEVWNAYL